MQFPPNGIDRGSLDQVFTKLGGHIEFPRRTGEIVYFHAIVGWPARANARRKDASRHLVRYVRIVMRALKIKM